MPLPFAAIPPIATAVGRYGVPYLVREVLKVGKDKFVNTYGNEAFTSINNLSIQSSELFQKEVENYTNDIDEGKEEETTGTELSTEIKKEEPPKLPEEPPKGPDIGTELATEAVTQATKKVLEDKKPNVSKQTKDLVRGIGDNNPPSSIEEETTENITQDNFITKDNVSVTNNLKTQNFLDDKLMDELLVIRGGIKGYNENMSSDFPKMPGATKAKMEIQLQKKLFDKYKINEYPEGETPETVTKERQEYLIHTYNKRLAAIEYVTSVAYDVIGRTDKEAMIVVDEDGLPIAGAKVESKFAGPQTYSKDALTITEMGSVFKNAGDQLFNDIIERAKKENKKFIVAEDLTSEGALQALKDRGFRTTTTKDTKKFKGHKIRRPNGRSAVQKNLVLDLSKQITKEQTDNLLKNK